MSAKRASRRQPQEVSSEQNGKRDGDGISKAVLRRVARNLENHFNFELQENSFVTRSGSQKESLVLYNFPASKPYQRKEPGGAVPQLVKPKVKKSVKKSISSPYVRCLVRTTNEVVATYPLQKLEKLHTMPLDAKSSKGADDIDQDVEEEETTKDQPRQQQRCRTGSQQSPRRLQNYRRHVASMLEEQHYVDFYYRQGRSHQQSKTPRSPPKRTKKELLRLEAMQTAQKFIEEPKRSSTRNATGKGSSSKGSDSRSSHLSASKQQQQQQQQQEEQQQQEQQQQEQQQQEQQQQEQQQQEQQQQEQQQQEQQQQLILLLQQQQQQQLQQQQQQQQHQQQQKYQQEKSPSPDQQAKPKLHSEEVTKDSQRSDSKSQSSTEREAEVKIRVLGGNRPAAENEEHHSDSGDSQTTPDRHSVAGRSASPAPLSHRSSIETGERSRSSSRSLNRSRSSSNRSRRSSSSSSSADSKSLTLTPSTSSPRNSPDASPKRSEAIEQSSHNTPEAAVEEPAAFQSSSTTAESSPVNGIAASVEVERSQSSGQKSGMDSDDPLSGAAQSMTIPDAQERRSSETTRPNDVGNKTGGPDNYDSDDSSPVVSGGSSSTTPLSDRSDSTSSIDSNVVSSDTEEDFRSGRQLPKN